MNRLHIVAADLDDARDQFTAALERDRADRGLAAATQAAREAVAGLTDDGPVRLVNTERARLTAQIERADREAEKWERIAAALDRRRETHRAEASQQEQAVADALAHVAEVRAEVVAPLIEQAIADGTDYLTGQECMWQAQAAHDEARRLRKRATGRAATEAAGRHHDTEHAVWRRWGGLPGDAASMESWAERVAGKRAEADPSVVQARQEAEQASRKQNRIAGRHLRESVSLRQRVLGHAPPSTAISRAAEWQARAEQARQDLAHIETLPVAEAAQFASELAARAEAERQAAERVRAEREARAARLRDFRPSNDRHRAEPGHDAPRL